MGGVREPIGRRTVMALLALSLAVFVIANDFSALSVALPQIEHDLNANVSTVQWVINAYALVFGVLIVTGGRLADMFGRRRIFFAGAAIFAVFSVLAGAAPDVSLLIACRAVMGIGGAMMWPAVLGMTFAALPASRSGLAGGLILGVAGIGNAFGPLLGGVLTDAASWRWVLFLNLPVAAFACLVVLREVPADQGSSAHDRVDYAGVATLSLGLVALLVALDQSTDWGLTDPRILGLFAVCVGGLLSCAAIERRAGQSALVPRDVFSSRAFVAAAGCVVLMSATFFAVLLYVPQVMQKLLGFTALQAGFGFLPMMAMFAVVSFVAGPLYDRVGGKLIICAGAAGLPIGVFMLSLAGDSGYWVLVPGMVVVGVGLGLFYSTITAAAVTALDSARTSLAGGIIYMCQIAGGAVGLGLTTTIFTRVAHGHVHSQQVAERLNGAQERAVGHILSGNETGQQLLASFPDAAAHLERVAHDAFLAGVQAAFRLDAALALGGFVIAVLFVGGRPRLRARRRAFKASADQRAAGSA